MSSYQAQLKQEHRERRAKWEAQAAELEVSLAAEGRGPADPVVGPYRWPPVVLYVAARAAKAHEEEGWPEEHWRAIDRMPTLMSKRAMRLVCEEFKVPANVLIGQRRDSELVTVRSVVMHLLRVRLRWSRPRIGKALGDRDHTTVIHALRRLVLEMAQDPVLAQRVVRLEEQVAA